MMTAGSATICDIAIWTDNGRSGLSGAIRFEPNRSSSQNANGKATLP
jgi:hypothetical protein